MPDWLNDFLTYAGTEAGDRAINVILAVLAAIGVVLLWVFGGVQKIWAMVFAQKNEKDQDANPPALQMRDNAKGGIAKATTGGIATGQVMGDQTIHQGAPTGHILLTSEQFVAHLEKERNKSKAELLTAHEDDKALLRAQIEELERQLANPEQALAQAKVRIADLETMLERLGNDIGGDRIAEARVALERGDYSIADELFAEIEAHRALEVQEAARAAYGRGEIAEAEVRWADAAEHYGRAARLNPEFSSLFSAREFAWRAGEYEKALRLGEELLSLTRAGDDQEQLGIALNEHAVSLYATGRYDEAEPLYREALEIARKALGVEHPSYGTYLNNLAGLLEATGRYGEAEPLYRESLEIDRKALGVKHPNYGIRLNALAGLLEATGRYDEAEPLYREALAVVEAVLGADHPDTILVRENLRRFLQERDGKGASENP